MTPTQKAALALLRRAEAEGHDPSDNAVHSGTVCFWDSGAWIGYRTAYALQRRGLAVVTFNDYDDYGSIALTGGSPPETIKPVDGNDPQGQS